MGSYEKAKEQFKNAIKLYLETFTKTMYFAKDRTQVRMELDGKQEKLSEYALHSSISTVFNCIYPSLFMILFIILCV